MYTKKELQKLVFRLCCSADEFYDEKSNRIQLPSQTIARYGRDIGRFEMSARMMYGKDSYQRLSRK